MHTGFRQYFLEVLSYTPAKRYIIILSMKIKTTNSSNDIYSVIFTFIYILCLWYIMMYMIIFYVIRVLEIFLTECGQLWIRDESPS